MAKTMSSTATMESAWCVLNESGEIVHRGHELRDALAYRRAHGGVIVRVDSDRSPGP